MKERTASRGLRREASILLPVSLLLFAALACVTLLSYRAAVARLAEEREGWALRQATALVERASALGDGELERMARTLPSGSAFALYDGRGALRWSTGFEDPERQATLSPRAPAVAAPRVDWLAASGGEDSRPGALVVWVPFARDRPRPTPDGTAGGRAGERWLARFETPEPGIGAARRGLAILTPVVFGLSAAVGVLALLFLYALNRPFETLLERAREVAPGVGAAGTATSASRGSGSAGRGGDEIDFLLATFDRALAALRSSDSDPTGGARRDAEARLAESVAQLGEMAAGVAHELRNSLATLKGYVGLLERRDLPAAAAEDLLELSREADALGRVVDDFLAFARPGVRDLTAVELGTLLDHALADPALDVASFTRVLPEGPVEIAGDARWLERALRNLLRNAVEAQSEGGASGPIEVELSRNSGRARIAIRDRGPGLAPEIAARLFEPFRSAKPGGAGLGLALARRIVLLHGGTLELRNRPDGGAEALVELPLLVTSVTIGN